MKLRILISAIFLAVFLVSCNAGNDKESDAIPTQPEVLTNVYLGEEIDLPEGYEFVSSVTPLYRDGIFTVLCRDEDDTFACPSRIVSFDENGVITGECEISYDPGNMSFHNGIIREDSIVLHYGYFSPAEKIRTAHLVRIDTADGSITESPDLIPLFSSPEARERFYKILGFEMDGDGYTYFFSETEMIVLDPAFGHVITYPSSGITESFAVRPDGKLTVYSSFSKGSGLYTPNPETKIPDTVIKTGTDETILEHWYDPAGNMYMKNDTGYYALTEAGCELLMDFRNSGVTADRIHIYSVPDRDLFLGAISSFSAYGDSGVNLQIFRKSEDIVVSEIEVIDVAALGEYYQHVEALVTDYNLLHRDKRIVVTEFGDMENGETHLMTAIQTGTYQPDMIIGAPENPVIRKIVEDGLYTDLMPYLESDAELSADNLFGSVKRMFSHGGKMWGISPKVSVKTVTASVKKVGDRTNWTLDELLDYAENLPEGEYLMYGAVRTKADEYILGPAGYSLFVDFETGTASFDSDLFVRYLEYAASLPESYEDYSEIFSGYRREALLSGKVSLDNAIDIIDTEPWLQLKANFPDGGHTIIGYPSDNAASSYATCDSAYVITSFADDPDEMWEVLKGIYPFDPGDVYYLSAGGLPSLKPIYNEIMLNEKYNVFRMGTYYISFGQSGLSSYTPGEDDKEPGMVVTFDETEADLMRDFLDNRCGTSVMDLLPGELDSIIREEVSAFLSGMGTAEDCGAKIQSRVNLWMSEHE